MSIAKRLVPRLGSNLYQTASYTLEGYTLIAVRALAANVKECEAPNCTRSEVVWFLTSMPTIRRLPGDLMSALPNLSAGISRGQMAPSESCIRVLATIIPPLVLTWWQPPTGRGRLQVQFMYVLVMGDGDIHMPKDNSRREILLDRRQVADLRVAALQDAFAMSERGFPLSPAWWRQLGQENRALQMEANLRALVTNHGRGKRKALSQATFPVDCILGEKAHQGDTLYLVRLLKIHRFM